MCSEQSILIKKSFMVGVQITQIDHKISIQGSFPSITTSVLASLIFGLLHIHLPSIIESSWTKFEREITIFLIKQYK